MVQDLSAEDLGFENEEPLHVLDLPQLYTRPSAATLLSTLADLTSQPSSWETTPQSGSRSISGSSTPARPRQKIRKEGVPAYLTKIVSSSLHWIEDDDEKEQIWQHASQELSARSGRSAQGDITRLFSIPLHEEGDQYVELSVHEPALTADNLGFKTWASAYLLAKRLCTLHDLPNCTTLELGAGTGLLGMATACVLKTDVISTDLPEIVTNLERNIKDNSLVISTYGSVSAAVLDWTQPEAFCFKGSFGLILAADVVYSSEQPHILSNTIGYHLAKTSEARLIIESALRGGFDEVHDFRNEMITLGLEIVEEGEEVGFDDWESSDSEPTEVACWWSVWKWSS